MSTVTFHIQEQPYRVALADLAETALEIRSVPRPYRVRQAPGAGVAEVARLLERHPRARLVADARVHDLHLEGLAVDPARRLTFPATEQVKSLAHGVIPLLDWLAEAGLTRTDPLVVVGGGIIQDIGGFAAHLFKRGLPWTFFPTTLLSQCDSCIGAKAGVNHGRFKNQLALFAAPREVVIDPGFLATLAPLELRSGLGEILKLHLTGGPYFADRFQAALDAAGDRLPALEGLRALTWDSLVVKRAVIERDEYELDHRRALNYGHTIGHAIENLSGFSIPHGQAIGLGMAIVNQLAVNRGLLDPRVHDRVLGLIGRLVDASCRAALDALDLGQLRDALSRDKKNTGNTLNLVVMTEVGRLAFLAVENDQRFSDELAGIVRALARG
jgi:3-dehydroquinate synthase